VTHVSHNQEKVAGGKDEGCYNSMWEFVSNGLLSTISRVHFLQKIPSAPVVNVISMDHDMQRITHDEGKCDFQDPPVVDHYDPFNEY
jgi:hypothetical protein